ncbi:Unknown protein, partial [Striga hermonthica]
FSELSTPTTRSYTRSAHVSEVAVATTLYTNISSTRVLCTWVKYSPFDPPNVTLTIPLETLTFDLIQVNLPKHCPLEQGARPSGCSQPLFNLLCNLQVVFCKFFKVSNWNFRLLYDFDNVFHKFFISFFIFLSKFHQNTPLFIFFQFNHQLSKFAIKYTSFRHRRKHTLKSKNKNDKLK